MACMDRGTMLVHLFTKDFNGGEMEKMDIKQSIKDLAGAIIFLLVLLILVSKISWIFRGNDTEARENILGFGNEKCSVDVILFAGSDVLRFYDPLEAYSKYGFTSYNYATSSAQADMLRFYAAESRKTCDAKVYVFDLRTITFVSDVISEPTLRNWSDSLPVFSWVRIRGIYSYLFNRNNTGVDIPSYFLDIIKYHSNYDSLASAYQWSFINRKSIYNIDKGFEPYKTHTPFEKPIQTETRGTISEKQLNALSDLLDYCDREKLNAIFICSPIVVKSEDQELFNAVSDYIVGRGYDFVDFNKYYDEIGLDFAFDYSDVNHVNYLGAKKFTDFFTDLLIDKYDLEDHRNDEGFSAWNEDYSKMAESRKFWMDYLNDNINFHVEANEEGKKLSSIDDFSEWYEKINNLNYYVIMKMPVIPHNLSDDNLLRKLLSDYEIGEEASAYIGVWRGNTPIYSSSDELETEVGLGSDGGRGTDKCILSAKADSIRIDDVDYKGKDGHIQFIIYDWNYMEVLDNVSVSISSDGSLSMDRCN